MRFSILRSGSGGNCTLIEHDSCRILLDAGMSQIRIREVLQEVELDPGKIQAIVVTHLHSDHCNYSTLQTCRKFDIPLFAHHKNIAALKSVFKKEISDDIKIIGFDGKPFQIGPLMLQPFELSHDACVVTSGFNIQPDIAPDNRLCYATDLGIFPDSLLSYFINAKIVVLESNHDTQLLWDNPRRTYVHKKRVAGEKGHLSNKQSADALIKICRNSLKKAEKVVLCHLSKDHNSPQLALDSVNAQLEEQDIVLSLHVAERDQRTPFFDIG